MIVNAHNGTFFVDRGEILHIGVPQPITTEYLFSEEGIVRLFELNVTLRDGVVVFVEDTIENIKKLRNELL